MQNKYIFTFWEPKNKMPAYIKLCMKTWEKFLPDYEIVNLNFKNLENYIPKEVLNKIIYKKLSLPQQADCIRAWLLHLNGGYWLDADTIITDGKIVKEMQNYEACFIGNAKTRSNIDIGFIYAKKSSRILKKWAEEIPNRVKNYKNYRNFKLFYQLFNYKEHKIRKHWGYFGHLITDELINKSSENEVFVLDRNEANVYLENNINTNNNQQAELGTPQTYREYYFGNVDYQKALNKNKGIIFLHNSWTPKEYKKMSEKEFLNSNTTLANILKELLEK